MRDIADRILGKYTFYREGSPGLREGLLDHVQLFEQKDLRDGHLFRVGDRRESICLVGNGGRLPWRMPMSRPISSLSS